jgi:glyoxylase-like metal-dependent hydrolase (beta-lactamase superfamily II)
LSEIAGALMAVINRSLTHRVQQLRTGLWQFTSLIPVTTNCWLIEEPDGLTMVDAVHPWSAGAILRLLQDLGVPLRRIIITHAHPDHAGSAAELSRKTGARVLAHELDAPYLTGKGCMADLPGSFGSRCLLRAGRKLNMLDPPRVEEVVPLLEGQQIGSLQTLHTPGHTPGSISLWSETIGGIFCGDNVSNTFNILRLNFSWFTLDHSTLRSSIQRYAQLPARMLLVGHGPVHESPDVVLDLQNLLGR